ncbi:MAG: hypothetical protein IKH54_03220 [Bacilli bacterium]|nr:hypothetical protein [Bacilli bacterium]
MSFYMPWMSDEYQRECEEMRMENEERRKFKKYMQEFLNSEEGLDLLLSKLETRKKEINKVKKIKK